MAEKLTPEYDELGREIVVQTGEEVLDAVGKAQVVSTASAIGGVPFVDAIYQTQEWKKQERYRATQENPEDKNGLGYQFTNTDNTEV